MIFINGVFGDKERAREDAKTLSHALGGSFGGQQVEVRVGYNPSHLAGLADVAQAIAQMMGGSISNFDRDTILRQVAPEVTIRKLLLVGHSQGALYANSLYDYLVVNGQPETSTGLYAVGTPGSYVAGSGKYITSATDGVISAVRAAASLAADSGLAVGPPLPSNTIIPLTKEESTNKIRGHRFSEVYLAKEPERIRTEIYSALEKLIPEWASDSEPCFFPPEKKTTDKVQEILFSVVDPTFSAGAQGVKVAARVGASVVGTAKMAYEKTASALGWTIGLFVPEARTENLPGSFTIVKSLYGSSLTEEDVEEILGNQGGAVALAVQEKKEGATIEEKQEEGIVAGAETEVPPVVPISQLQPVPVSPGFGGGATPATASVPVEQVPEVEEVPAQEIQEEAEELPEETEEILSPPVISGVVIAQQADASISCAWRSCFTFNGEEGPDAFYDLGWGEDISADRLTSVTIAKDESDPEVGNPWLVQVYCFSDMENGILCDGWGPQNFVIDAFATSTENNKYWTAYFSDAPSFRGGEFYRLVVNDDGWPTGGYGSSDNKFYFVARGQLAPDTTPPSVVSFSPANESVGLPLDTYITVTFSEPVLPSSVEPLAITMFNYSTGNFESVILSLDSSGTVVTITPQNLLAPNSIYGPVVTSHIADLAGNRPPVNLVDGGEQAHFFTVTEELVEETEEEITNEE